MGAWNGILKSLHSALIDELNERYPDEKPELGLPSRSAGWALAPQSRSALLVPVAAEGGAGIAALGALSSQTEADLEQLFRNLLKRAAPDFARLEISPRFAKAVFSPNGSLPKGIPAPAMVIWLPISLSLKKERFVFDLGVGV